MAEAAGGAVRWTVSALVIGAPLFLFLSWRVGQARRRNPAMQGSRIRKWLTYLTLVIAAATLIGDGIALVSNFLAGELTPRFLLKALIIAVIAGVIFLYYVRDAERDEDAPTASGLDWALGGGLAAVAIAASVTGVALIDSPATLRARERDEARLTAIANIAGGVDCYYTYENALPETLAIMRETLAERSSTTPLSCAWSEEDLDPATNEPYEFRPIDATSFEVCATFDLASREAERPDTRSYSYNYRDGGRSFNAIHGAGRHCFTLTAESLTEDRDGTPLR
jgi:hypothetical protein